MKPVTPIESFRHDNGLTKKEIAEYLGVSQAFIGRVCSGQYNLPEKQLQKLLSNNRGWNTTELEKKISLEEQTFTGNLSGKELLQSIKDETARIESILNETIRAKDEQIERLTRIIENLSKRQ